MPIYEFEMVASLVQKADQALYHSKTKAEIVLQPILN